MFRRGLVLCGVLLCIQPYLYGQPIVPAVERFRDDGSISSEALGRVLTQELNCVACHADPQQEGKQAPILTDVSTRVKADYLLRFIEQPQEVKPGTTMPNVLAGVPKQQRQRESTALVHYLMSLGEGKPPHAYASYGSRRRGEALYHQLGCTACHDALGAVADDRRSARLYIDGLQEGHVHELHLDGVRSAEGLPLLHPVGYYTLNYIPSDKMDT